MELYVSNIVAIDDIFELRAGGYVNLERIVKKNYGEIDAIFLLFDPKR